MWEMAPNEQNWEGDSICCSMTDSVCIGSCWMPARLRPAEQECCTGRGEGTAWPSTLPAPGWKAEPDYRAAGPSWHLLHAGEGCGEVRLQPQLLRTAHLPPLPPFQFSSSNLPTESHQPSVHCGPLLVQPWLPQGCLGWGSPGTAAFDNLHIQNSPLQQ